MKTSPKGISTLKIEYMKGVVITMAKLTDAQKRAVNKYQKEKLEIVSFRVKKGKRRAYNELAKIKELPLSNIMESYLDNECRVVGIIPDDYIIKGGEKIDSE